MHSPWYSCDCKPGHRCGVVLQTLRQPPNPEKDLNVLGHLKRTSTWIKTLERRLALQCTVTASCDNVATPDKDLKSAKAT